MPYAILAHPKAQRDLDALPPAVAHGLRAVLGALAADPRGRRFDLKKLQAVDGEPSAQRLRVGQYRVILRIDHAAREILVARIGHRRVVYRGLASAFD